MAYAWLPHIFCDSRATPQVGAGHSNRTSNTGDPEPYEPRDSIAKTVGFATGGGFSSTLPVGFRGTRASREYSRPVQISVSAHRIRGNNVVRLKLGNANLN